MQCFTFVLCLFVPFVSGWTCMPRNTMERHGIAQYGDIMIGGIFPIHGTMATPEHSYKEPPGAVQCLRFDQRRFQWTMSMIFAISEINKSQILLPNITLGYVINDNCYRMQRSIENSLKYIESRSADEEPCFYQVVMTTLGSSETVAIDRMLGIFHTPQISGAAACKCLSNKKNFPAFMRTAPSDLHHADAVAHLVLHFKWVFVGAFAVDDDFGRTGINQILNTIETNGGCIAFNELLPKVKNEEKIQQFVILYSNEQDASPLIEELLLQNVTGKTWLGTSDWIRSKRYSSSHYAHILRGSMGFIQIFGEIPGFHEFLKSLNFYIIELWEDVFGCTWDGVQIDLPPCSGLESLEKVYAQFTDVSDLHISTYQSAYVIAYALMDIQSCTAQNTPFQNGSCVSIDDFQPWELLVYLRNVRWKTTMGTTMFFDENGDPPGPHDLIIWDKDANGTIFFKKIGHFASDASPGKKLSVDVDGFHWNSGSTKVPQSVCSEPCVTGTRKVALKGEPFCCFDCIPCTNREYSNGTDSTECLRCITYYWSNEDRNGCVPMPEDYLAFTNPAALVILSFNLLGILIVVIVGIILFRGRDSPVMKDTDGRVVTLFLLALMVSLLSSLILIGAPDDVKCPIRDPLVCSAHIYVFNIVDLTCSTDGSLYKFKLLKEEFLVLLCLMPQIIFCLLWAFVGEPRLVRTVDIQPNMVTLECGGTSTAWPVGSLSYLVFLAISCYAVAFKALKLDIVHKEAKFITFSMTVCLLVCLAFVPAYNSTQGTFNHITKIAAVIVTSLGLLGCIMLPKCYMVLVKNIDRDRDILTFKSEFWFVRENRGMKDYVDGWRSGDDAPEGWSQMWESGTKNYSFTLMKSCFTIPNVYSEKKGRADRFFW
uniref:G-protein coupled receptors family 3 profile domain-containing protein n=1 Tax=Eptatretus burgeri TaxID=7764 RepID=A0A8C4PYG2_EPTBU